MLSYEEYIQQMEKIYDKFLARKQELIESGTSPESMVEGQEGCFAIVFRQPSWLAGALAAYSRKVAETVPAMIYGPGNIQTTIYAYGLADRFYYDPDDQAQRDTISQLSCAVANGLAQLKQSVIDHREIRFGQLLFSRGVVLAPGYPNQDNWQIVQSILQAGRGLGLEMKDPWGSQCVVSRFIKKWTSEEQFRPFYLLSKLMEEAPKLGSVQPVSVDVVDNTMHRDKQFTCTTHASFPL